MKIISDPNVGDEFAAFDVVVSPLDGIFVFHFVILALGGNAPAVDIVDAGIRIEKGMATFAETSAAGAQNLVGAAVDFLELAVGLDDQDFFGIEKDGVRFFHRGAAAERW